MNEAIYKKRQATKTTLDLLTQSNREPQKLSLALETAKSVLGSYPEAYVGAVKIIAAIYQEQESIISNLLD